MVEEEKETEKKLRQEVYKNRQMFITLNEKYILLKADLQNIESKLREQVPIPSKELAEIKERLTKLENTMTLYVDAIQKVITKPSAAGVITEAEGELKEIAFWSEPTLEAPGLSGERIRHKRQIPESWQEQEQEHIIVQDRKRWKQAFKRTRELPTGPTFQEPEAEEISSAEQESLKKMYAISEGASKKKKEEEEKKKKTGSKKSD
jgi:hypothetical protein